MLAPGYLADINIIDMDRIKLGKPWLAFDLPAGGKRLLQKADGYCDDQERKGHIPRRRMDGRGARWPDPRPAAGRTAGGAANESDPYGREKPSTLEALEWVDIDAAAPVGQRLPSI